MKLTLDAIKDAVKSIQSRALKELSMGPFSQDQGDAAGKSWWGYSAKIYITLRLHHESVVS